MAFPYANQTVLVTGASSGIGAAFARALARRGSDLVLVARRLERLDRLAGELRAESGVRVDTVPFDLSEDSPGPRLAALLAERGIRVTSLLNCAGFGSYGPFAEHPSRRLESELAVDVLAPVSLTSAFLPQLRDQGTGFLINVGSMAAYNPSPRLATYGAAKAFVLNFTEALWAELRGTGLTVFALSPGATSTEFNDVAGSEDATAGARKRTPEQVVATALQHLERRDPGPSVIDGSTNRIAAALGRLLPRRSAVLAMDRLSDPERRRRRSRPA